MSDTDSGLLQGHPIQTSGDTTSAGAPGTGTAGTTATGLPALDPARRYLNPLPVGQYSDGIILGDGARLGLRESWSILQGASVMRAWTGEALVNSNPYDKKHSITWKGSGKAMVEGPALGQIQPGDTCNLWALTPQSEYIDVGETSVTLWFDAVTQDFGGFIRATLQSTGQVVPVRRVGRVVSLLRDPGGDIVTLRYRPIVPVVILKWSTEFDQVTGLISYDCAFEEQ